MTKSVEWTIKNVTTGETITGKHRAIKERKTREICRASDTALTLHVTESEAKSWAVWVYTPGERIARFTGMVPK